MKREIYARQLRLLAAAAALLAGGQAWATDITSCPYTITAPGEYHVTQNLVCTSGQAITIAASNVRLFLDGHTLTGNGSGSIGIYSLGQSSVTIANGAITGFTFLGVFLDDGCSRFSLSNLLVTRNRGGIGLDFSSNSSISRCISSNNGFLGINLIGSSNNRIFANATTNNASTGIGLQGNSNGNTVGGNFSSANGADGIAVVSGSSGNTITANVARSNAVFDLRAGDANCGSNRWSLNQFRTAKPASCIR